MMTGAQCDISPVNLISFKPLIMQNVPHQKLSL